MSSLGWAWKGSAPDPVNSAKRKKRKAKRKKTQSSKRPGQSRNAVGKNTKSASWSSKFYKSFEWKQARYRALQYYGRRCMCCGAGPEDGKVIVVDHIKPIRKHPKLRLAMDNLQVLCNDCNWGKGSSDETDFRPEALSQDAAAHMMSIIMER